MVGLQTLDLAIGVRVPASQPKTNHLSLVIFHLSVPIYRSTTSLALQLVQYSGSSD